MISYFSFNEQRFRTYRLYLLYVLLILLVSGCGDSSEPGTSESLSSTSTDTGSASFAIQWHTADADRASAVVRQAIGNCQDAGVASITCKVYNEARKQIASGGPWDCDAHTGRVESIPAGSNRMLVVLGWNGANGGGDAVYQGHTASNITISPGQITDAGTIDAIEFVPTGLVANADTDNQINLSWNGSGFGRYRIYRDGVYVGDSPSTTYSDPDLSADTNYCYTVSAVDGVGNESGPCDQACAVATGPCSYAISPTSDSFTAGAGTGSISVSAPNGCDWTATETANWINITSGASGSGNGTVNYSVTANTSINQRSAVITVAGQQFNVTQAGITCSYSISPTSASFSADADTGTISVTALTGCAWTATETANWINITSGASGSGNGTVNYSVTANTDINQRNAVITVAGQQFPVTQAGIVCTYSISPTSASFSANADTGSIGVTAPSGCAWTATETANWINITSGASGSGNGTVNYSVTANTGTNIRRAIITAAEQQFLVTQAGCVLSVTIGDNDGYGNGASQVPDNENLPQNSGQYPWVFDNRENSERSATDGAQHTDYEPYDSRSFSFTITFCPVNPNDLYFATLLIDVSGIQASSYGESTLLLDDQDYSEYLNQEQGVYGSDVISIPLPSAMLEDGQLTIDFQGGLGTNYPPDFNPDAIAFDFFDLDIVLN